MITQERVRRLNQAFGKAVVDARQQRPAAAQEDRGTHYDVWEGGGAAAFNPFPGATTRHTVSVPIGWAAKPAYGEGVVLVNTFLDFLTAKEVCDARTRERHGIKLLATHAASDEVD